MCLDKNRGFVINCQLLSTEDKTMLRNQEKVFHGASTAFLLVYGVGRSTVKLTRRNRSFQS